MMQEKSIDVDGIRTSYIEEGSGSPVVFVHGLGGYKENWETNVPVFGERHRAIALDLPGYGRSDKPDVPYGPAFFGPFVGKFMKALGIPRAHLVGNSMGGHTVSLLAALNPASVDRLVLVDPTGSPELVALASGAMTVDMLEAMGPVNPGEDFVRMYLSLIFFKPGEYSEKMVRRAMAEFELGENEVRFRAFIGSLKGIFAHDMTPHYGKIGAPTMVFWGENDLLVPVSHADEVAGAIPGAKKLILPECGHCPMIEKPEEFNRVVMDFLA